VNALEVVGKPEDVTTDDGSRRSGRGDGGRALQQARSIVGCDHEGSRLPGSARPGSAQEGVRGADELPGTSTAQPTRPSKALTSSSASRRRGAVTADGVRRMAKGAIVRDGEP
jgi:hypothetical protein